MTPTKLTLAERLAAVSAEVERLGHDGQMQGGGSYKYTSINAIADAARPLLAKHGVTIIPGGVEVLSHEALNKGYHVVIRREWRITDGVESFGADSIGASSDSSDKAYNKAHTYARKNFLVDLLNLSTGEDPDSERPETAPRVREWEGRGMERQSARPEPRAPRPSPEPKTNYENVVAEGKARGLTLDAIHDAMKSAGFVMPSDLNAEGAYAKAIDAVRGVLKVDDKGGLPTGVEVPVITQKQVGFFKGEVKRHGLTEDEGRAIVADLAGVLTSKEIPKSMFNTILEALETAGQKKKEGS